MYTILRWKQKLVGFKLAPSELIPNVWVTKCEESSEIQFYTGIYVLILPLVKIFTNIVGCESIVTSMCRNNTRKVSSNIMHASWDISVKYHTTKVNKPSLILIWSCKWVLLKIQVQREVHKIENRTRWNIICYLLFELG